jgi:hypothetical protein
MDKELTVFEMINYEMPKCTKIPLNDLTQHKSLWGLPKFTQTKIFENSTAQLILKHCYKDTSREQQISFLQRSGKIKVNKEKSKSLNRMLGCLPVPNKSFKRSLSTRKSSRNMPATPKTSNMLIPSISNTKRILKFNFTPMGRLGSYLAKISNK